ncbi:MAG: rhodanese-like domain-containing protein [Deltaproteobacteria bacterium]|jgi:hypothetical protein|nr:rhodanese-like domain-containing protein [Deltaproteobacteria bacterium]
MRIRKTTGVPFFVGLMIAFCFSVISASSAIAQDWKFHSIVDVNFVQQYVKIPAPKDVFIIDSRPTKLKYDKGYIPNAINIPDSSFDKFKHLLPENKDALLIFYCQGPS